MTKTMTSTRRDEYAELCVLNSDWTQTVTSGDVATMRETFRRLVAANVPATFTVWRRRAGGIGYAAGEPVSRSCVAKWAQRADWLTQTAKRIDALRREIHRCDMATVAESAREWMALSAARAKAIGKTFTPDVLVSAEALARLAE